MEFVLIGLVVFVISMVLQGKNTSSLRPGAKNSGIILADFQAQVQGMLEPDEVMEASCGYKPCAAVTNKRLLITTKERIQEIPFSEIKGLYRVAANESNPNSFVTLTIEAEKKYYLGNYTEGFEEVYSALKKHTGLS